MSTRFTDLPISFQSLGSFSFTSLGGSSLAAASATLPKLILRGPGPCTMKLLDAAHSEAGTPHSCAAAAISISRAVAPALRRYSCELRMVRLPTAAMSPQARLRLTFALAEAYSIFTRRQSQPSSSATSMGAEVMLPCPISERAKRMMMPSSGRITTQALISAPASAFCANTPRGPQPMVSPPPIAADCFRNFLREVVMAVSLRRLRRLHGLRRGVDRRADARVGAATADVGHRRVDVLVAGTAVLGEQRHRRHDLARLAVAALRDLVVDPGLLHRVQLAALREPFDGQHLLAGGGGHRHRARAHRLAVQVNGAGAALGDAAAEFGALHVEHVAQHPQQGHFGLDVDVVLLAVDGEFDHSEISLGSVRCL